MSKGWLLLHFSSAGLKSYMTRSRSCRAVRFWGTSGRIEEFLARRRDVDLTDAKSNNPCIARKEDPLCENQAPLQLQRQAKKFQAEHYFRLKLHTFYINFPPPSTNHTFQFLRREPHNLTATRAYSRSPHPLSIIRANNDKTP